MKNEYENPDLFKIKISHNFGVARAAKFGCATESERMTSWCRLPLSRDEIENKHCYTNGRTQHPVQTV